MDPVLIVILGVAVVALVAVFGYLQDKKRRETFMAAAAANGWTYEARNDAYTERWAGRPFGQGHNRQARNVLTGTHDGRPFTALDYVYYTTETSTDSSGRTTRREVAHRFSVVALDVGVSFPNLTVRPEGPVGRFFGKLTNRDIQFESEAFNRAFTVTCEDRRFASDVIHPRMMDVLLTDPQTAFRIDRHTILTIDDGQHSIDQVTARLGMLDRIVDNIPKFVWDQVGGPD